jgi:predicted transcriptional regulator
VLRTLEEKGLVAHHRQGRTRIFLPARGTAGVRRQLLSEMLNRVFSGSLRPLLAALLDTDAVTPEMLDEVRPLLDDAEASGDGP